MVSCPLDRQEVELLFTYCNTRCDVERLTLASLHFQRPLFSPLSLYTKNRTCRGDDLIFFREGGLVTVGQRYKWKFEGVDVPNSVHSQNICSRKQASVLLHSACSVYVQPISKLSEEVVSTQHYIVD